MRSSGGSDEKRGVRGVAVVLAVTGLLGCGPAPDDGGGRPAGTGEATSVGTFPHARTHLQCAGPVGEVGAGDYVDGGLERVQGDPVAAVRDLVEEGYRGPLPRGGYELARAGDEWALVVVEGNGAVEVAFVVEDGVRDWGGGVGWGVTSYAACDLAELVPEVAEQAGIDVWTDATGARVPTTQVQSYPGPEHCDWQDITFLQLGDFRKGQQYLRDVDGALARWTRTSYAEQVQVPEDATDSGWRRDGRALWLVPDRSAAFLVDLVDLDEVGGPKIAERWPGAKEPIGCM